MGSAAETDFDQKVGQLLVVAYVKEIPSGSWPRPGLAVQGAEEEEFAGVPLVTSACSYGQTDSFLAVPACDSSSDLAH